jgi:MFS family permease
MTGSYVSMLGSRITTIACPLLALYLTNSPVAAGLVAFAATVPSILIYIPAGALVDHWDPRRTLLVCESGRGVAIAAVAMMLTMGRLSLLLLIVMVFVEEILEVFSTLADRRCLRSFVPVEQASSAQARIEARTHVVVLAGRPLGAFLFSLTPTLPFLTDALSFMISVSTIVNLKSKQAVAATTSRVSWRRLRKDIGEGLSWLLHDKYSRAAMTLSAGTTVIVQALIMVFLAEAHSSKLPSVTVGLVLAASGAGGVLGSASGVLGSIAASRLLTPLKASLILVRPSLILVQMLAWVGAFAVLAKWGPRSLPCMAIVLATLSLTGALGNIEIGTYLIRNVRENMLARATSIGRLMAFSACAIGPMLGGVLIQWHGAQHAVLALLAITSALALLTVCSPSMRYHEGVSATGASGGVAASSSPVGDQHAAMAALRPQPDTTNTQYFLGVDG